MVLDESSASINFYSFAGYGFLLMSTKKKDYRPDPTPKKVPERVNVYDYKPDPNPPLPKTIPSKPKPKPNSPSDTNKTKE